MIFGKVNYTMLEFDRRLFLSHDRLFSFWAVYSYPQFLIIDAHVSYRHHDQWSGTLKRRLVVVGALCLQI
jgi:hypothetical protein